MRLPLFLAQQCGRQLSPSPAFCRCITAISLDGTRAQSSRAALPAGTEAVAHRDGRIARGGRTTACNGTGSAQHGGIPFGRRQPAYGEPRLLATRSGTPPRADRGSAARVAILVALC